LAGTGSTITAARSWPCASTIASSARSSSSGATSVCEIVSAETPALSLAASPASPLGVPVIAAFELQHVRALRGRARDAQCRHHRFGAGRDEPHALDPRQGADDPLGQRERVRLACAERPAAIDGLVDDARDVGIAMPEDQRAEALTEVDVRASLDIGEPRALRRGHEHGGAAHALERADRTVHAARRRLRGTLEKRVVHSVTAWCHWS
jgi:hypothetical protein